MFPNLKKNSRWRDIPAFVWPLSKLDCFFFLATHKPTKLCARGAIHAPTRCNGARHPLQSWLDSAHENARKIEAPAANSSAVNRLWLTLPIHHRPRTAPILPWKWMKNHPKTATRTGTTTTLVPPQAATRPCYLSGPLLDAPCLQQLERHIVFARRLRRTPTRRNLTARRLPGAGRLHSMRRSLGWRRRWQHFYGEGLSSRHSKHLCREVRREKKLHRWGSSIKTATAVVVPRLLPLLLLLSRAWKHTATATAVKAI